MAETAALLADEILPGCRCGLEGNYDPDNSAITWNVSFRTEWGYFETYSPRTIQDGVCDGMEAVIFAAGSGGSTGPDMTDKVDRDGAKRLIDLTHKAGVTRFVMLSSVGADQSNPTGKMAHYLQAKHEADEHLKSSGMAYAILRPVALTDDGRGADVILGEDVDKSAKAARADVAHVLAEAATTGRFDGSAQDMQSA